MSTFSASVAEIAPLPLPRTNSLLTETGFSVIPVVARVPAVVVVASWLPNPCTCTVRVEKRGQKYDIQATEVKQSELNHDVAETTMRQLHK